jgi:hypothetical protein
MESSRRGTSASSLRFSLIQVRGARTRRALRQSTAQTEAAAVIPTETLITDLSRHLETPPWLSVRPGALAKRVIGGLNVPTTLQSAVTQSRIPTAHQDLAPILLPGCRRIDGPLIVARMYQSHCARHGRGIVQIADIDRDTEQADD